MLRGKRGGSIHNDNDDDKDGSRMTHLGRLAFYHVA